jgi:Reverse transcriptase (RNA-dependent DNA polymerase)
MYSNELSNSLSQIAVPCALLSGCTSNCCDPQHFCIIDKYYRDVINCVLHSVDKVIPVRSIRDNEFNVPGWNDYVQDKYDLSREAFLDWVYSGRPRAGVIFACMSRSRASFKLALRYCRQHVDQMRADACAKALNFNDSKSFWTNVKKVNSNKATKFANCVGGASGDSNIASLWREHFDRLYNSVKDDVSKDKFYERINSCHNSSESCNVSMHEIASAILKQKKGKAAGPDGIAMEAFIYGNNMLVMHLSFLFNLFLMHCHVPPLLVQSLIVPLVKAKGGDLTDVNNYRAISLSNSLTKILESVFMNKVKSFSDYDDHQFGFKAGHSTGLCTNTMKKVIDYYTSHGSHIFVCFVDFSKAFDKVNYWKLFNKLLDDNIDGNIVGLLAMWYSNQQACVQWKNTISDPIRIGNGTRQGGLLSPYFFTRYIRELICSVAQSGVGCNLGGVFYNLLAYADDIVLLAPSWQALQSLINLLNSCASDINMLCNVAKTVCMVFKPKRSNMIVASNFPHFNLNGVALQFVSEFKYLGHIINNELSDDNDIKREIRLLFMRTNILIRRFNKCSVYVKLSLFKAYCMCLYDVGIWMHYSATFLNKFKSCYHKCVKMLFGYKRLSSVTSMLSELQLPDFDQLITSCRQSTYNCSVACINKLVSNLFAMTLL